MHLIYNAIARQVAQGTSFHAIRSGVSLRLGAGGHLDLTPRQS